jgi:hypothetical protein
MTLLNFEFLTNELPTTCMLQVLLDLALPQHLQDVS